MSIDLFQNEAVNRLSNLPPVKVPAPTTFQGFASGTGAYAMRSLASVGRAIDMAGAVGPIIQDAFTGGTVAQERYFKEHDDIFNSAVDFWTPRPSDVGAAGQVAGQLLGTLPVALASPELAVLGAGFGTAEDAVKNGASPDQAVGAGMVQGATAGLGMWLPILGKTGWQRVAVGGALGNTVLGAASRGATGEILDGTPAAEQFKAFDPTSLTLDTLMGAAFGTMAHLNPAQRAQGAQAWHSIGEWAQGLRASDRDALATLRLGQHLNVDSAPGHLDTPQAIDAHVTRMRTALDQILRDEPVELSNLPSPRTTPDETRVADMSARTDMLRAEGDVISRDLGLPNEFEFTGNLIGVHGSEKELSKIDNPSNVSPDIRYDSNGGVWGSGFYSAEKGDYFWFSGQKIRMPDYNYAKVVESTFKKSVVLTPETTLRTFERLGAKDLSSPEAMSEFLQSKGYDGVIVRGFAEKDMDAIVEKLIEAGIATEKMERMGGAAAFINQVVHFNPEKGVKILGNDPLLASMLSRKVDINKALSKLAKRFDFPRLADAEIILKKLKDDAEYTRHIYGDERIKRANELVAAAKTLADEAASIKEKITSIATESQSRKGTEAQPAKAAPLPPPPGEAKPAGASAQPDLLAQEAQRIVATRPDAVITTGRNPDGSPISTTVSQYLHDTLADVALAREQSRLFEVAATCMIGKM